MKKLYFLLNLLLPFLLINKIAAAQWYVDTATNAEIQAHDQPYIILEKELAKLCNRDWGIPQNPFLLLKNEPYHRLILRGKSIDAFSFTSAGDACTIKLKQTSPIFKAILDSIRLLMNEEADHMKLEPEMWRNSAKNNYKISASEKRTVDSLKRVDKILNNKLDDLQEEQTFADISLDINENWTRDLGNGTKNQLMAPIAGIKYTVLSIVYPDEDRSDTSYYAYLYLGNWPRPDLKKRVLYNFVYNDHYGANDRKHAGPPIIENFEVSVISHKYNNLMKVLHNIDWSKFDELIKR